MFCQGLYSTSGETDRLVPWEDVKERLILNNSTPPHSPDFSRGVRRGRLIFVADAGILCKDAFMFFDRVFRLWQETRFPCHLTYSAS